MNTYIGFLRAVNVGGTGKLAMSDLRNLCTEIGFTNTQTYIASGNVVFTSDKTATAVKNTLESALREFANKDIGVVVRTARELHKVLIDNPYADRDPKRTVAVFLDKKPAKDVLANATGVSDEEMQLGAREIYVYYGSGIGHSKLKLPASKSGTARNVNTIRKMVELSS